MRRLDQYDANGGQGHGLYHSGPFWSLPQAVQPLLNIAVKAARRAGDIIVRAIPRLEAIQVESKGRNDFVTEVDKAAEADIIQTIRRLHPDHAILAEESGASGTSDVVWIIDPLDGTTNFMHGFPTFAVSIACQIRGRLEHAVVFDPMRQEIFTASRGDGAQVEGRKMRVSKQITLEGSLIATGFSVSHRRALSR
jgi:myo-inositol-1(or 4)-monophosphatase